MKQVGWTWVNFPGKKLEERRFSVISPLDGDISPGTMQELIEREINAGNMTRPEPVYIDDGKTESIKRFKQLLWDTMPCGVESLTYTMEIHRVFFTVKSKDGYMHQDFISHDELNDIDDPSAARSLAGKTALSVYNGLRSQGANVSMIKIDGDDHD